MRNLLNSPWKCSKCQTRAEETAKDLEPTYYLSIFELEYQDRQKGLKSDWVCKPLVGDQSVSRKNARYL